MRITVVAATFALALASCVTTNGDGDGAAAGADEGTGERVCQTYKVTGSRVPKTVCRPKK